MPFVPQVIDVAMHLHENASGDQTVRTTINLPNEKRAKLAAIAARRGLRGYSQLINEALDRFLKEEEEREARVAGVLALRGTLSDRQAEEVERRIREVWARWRGDQA